MLKVYHLENNESFTMISFHKVKHVLTNDCDNKNLNFTFFFFLDVPMVLWVKDVSLKILMGPMSVSIHYFIYTLSKSNICQPQQND